MLLVAAAAATQAPAEREPIGCSGCGQLFAPGSQDITLTAEFVSAAQAHCARPIQRSASAQQRVALDLTAGYLADVTHGDARAAAVACTHLLDRCSPQMRPACSAAFSRRSRASIAMLRNALASGGRQLPEATRALLRHAEQNPGPGNINRKCNSACHNQGDAGRFPALPPTCAASAARSCKARWPRAAR